MKNLLPLFILILLLNSIVFCNSIENGWKEIKPLETNRATVDKLLGQPEIDDNGYHIYETDEALVRIIYTETPCKDHKFKRRGEYNVAKDTVLEYWVVLKQRIKLSEIQFDQEKYYKDTSGDLTSHADYDYFEEGIRIGVYIQEDVEYVTGFSFRPGKRHDEMYKCMPIN